MCQIKTKRRPGIKIILTSSYLCFALVVKNDQETLIPGLTLGSALINSMAYNKNQ